MILQITKGKTNTATNGIREWKTTALKFGELLVPEEFKTPVKTQRPGNGILKPVTQEIQRKTATTGT